jgi:hypothetical protein
MYDQREESLRRPEEGGTAGDLGIKLILLPVGQEVSFLTMAIQIFARLLGVCGSLRQSYLICTACYSRLVSYLTHWFV